MVAHPLSRIFNPSTQGFEDENDGQDSGSNPRVDPTSRACNIPTGNSAESLSSVNFAGPVIRPRKYGSLSSNLSALSLLDTGSNMEVPKRRFSPNAVAIRASPRRRKRTHERKLTVAIKVADLAAKTSSPMLNREAECVASAEESTEGHGSEDSIGELILECPASPDATRNETIDVTESRRAFGGIMDHGNGPTQTQKVLFKSGPIPMPSSPTSPRSFNDDISFSRVYPKIAPIPSLIGNEQFEGFQTITQSSSFTQIPTSHKYAEYAAENSGWKGSRALESSKPPSREKEYQTFGSSPTRVGFAPNFMQSMSRRNRAELIPGRDTVAKLVPAQREEVKANDYDSFSAQFASRHRYHIDGLDGCGCNESIFVEAILSKGTLDHDSSLLLANKNSEQEINQCGIPGNEQLQRRLSKQEFAYSAIIEFEQSIQKSYEPSNDEQ